jgi:hypothetical protein
MSIVDKGVIFIQDSSHSSVLQQEKSLSNGIQISLSKPPRHQCGARFLRVRSHLTRAWQSGLRRPAHAVSPRNTEFIVQHQRVADGASSS